MATLRVLMKIEVAGSGGRSWDEQFYVNSSNPTPSVLQGNFIRALCVQRAGCLPTVANIRFARVNDVTTPNVTVQYDLQLPGALPSNSAFGADLVNVSLKVSARSAGGRRAEFLVRCPADGDVNNGIFNYAANGAAPYNGWRNTMTLTPFLMRRSVFGAPLALEDVSTTGVKFSLPPVGVVKGTLINIRTRVVGNGPAINTNVIAQGPPSTTNVVAILGWAHGNCIGGNARIFTYSYDAIDSANVTSTVGRTRKTGGPFTRFRGRR